MWNIKSVKSLYYLHDSISTKSVVKSIQKIAI